ncbi:hypothetical protein CCMSSC00406_0007105 [Pleurotus cornucopiae]|uniref:Uncharacterized protein n=1 Tax=Pleurotus cornucopiae TaxID=5321 RepID=A0ACB7IR74_PLECO|nr:hypothetical protein CCMSSC00406_0007105 [Pleurotus cornucopiae]
MDAAASTGRRKVLRLKSLLAIPGGFTGPTSTKHEPIVCSTSIVPGDVILAVADLLAPSDVLNLSLASTKVRALLTPTLYATVVLKSSRQCRIALEALSDNPRLCAHIRKLAVRPNYYLAWPKPDEPLDEDWVAKAIIDLAPHLKYLHTFDWDGLEMPEDELWTVLRTSCPDLKTVYSNVGCRPLNAESTLFSFHNLTSFSLIVRHGLGGLDLFPPTEELPDRLWDMLLKRCPDLEEITLCSFSSSARLLAFDRITAGRFPKLHTLTLGSFGYTSDFTISYPGSDSSTFSDFLANHDSLKHIRLSWNFKRWVSPETIPMHLPPTALSNLQTYIGIYQQLSELPHPESIETVDLTCEPIYEIRLRDITPVLNRLTSLTTLDIWVYIPNTTNDYTTFFMTLLQACPKLTELHFMCTTGFTSKPLKRLSSLLSLLPDLKTFSLTKGHKYRDETMLQSALQIVKDNPRLTQINVRWARETCPNHLKQEGTYDIVHSNIDLDGDLGEGGHGNRQATKNVPTSINVFERGLTVVGKSFTRQYSVNLRPKGKLATLKRGVMVQRYR